MAWLESLSLGMRRRLVERWEEPNDAYREAQQHAAAEECGHGRRS